MIFFLEDRSAPVDLLDLLEVGATSETEFFSSEDSGDSDWSSNGDIEDVENGDDENGK